MAPHQTPPLHVSRIRSACTRCRTAKTKCDGKLPACTACERAGKADLCSSPNEEYAHGQERSYVASLESQVERLMAERQHRIAALAAGTAPAPMPPFSSSETGQPQTNVHDLHRQREASDVGDLVSDFGYLAVNSTASGYQGFVQEMSFARLLFSTATVSEPPQPSITALPRREAATALVEECLRKVLTFYPILTSTAIFGALESVYRHGGQYASPLEHWNLRMVLAIASLSRSTEKGDAQYQRAVAHAYAAAEHREAVIQPGQMSSLQAILLLVLYALMNPSHFSPWYCNGMAARVMVDIGLHQDPPKEAHMRPAHLELRRRVFFCGYMLDRLITTVYVRLPSLTDASVDVQLPPPLTAFIALPGFVPQPPNTWVQLLKIRQIQSGAFGRLFLVNRDELYKPWTDRIPLMNQVRLDCSRLKQSLPATLAPIVDTDMCYFDLLLLQPAGGEQPLDPYGEILVFQYAIYFATNMGLICDQAWAESCATVLDLDRTMRVSRWLLEILPDDAAPALAFLNPPFPYGAEGLSPPDLPTWNLSERWTCAISALTQLDRIIESLSRRFHPPEDGGGYALPAVASARMPGSRRVWNYESFKRESRETLERLYNGVPL